MVRASKGETVSFDKCIKREHHTGVVESVLGKGTVDESYVVRLENGNSVVISPRDVESSMLSLRRKNPTKSKSKRPFSKKSGNDLQSFMGGSKSMGSKAGRMLKSIYRKKKSED